jgi:hypothetical protein
MSYKIFFKKFNNKNVKINLLLKDDLYIRNSYFGGRCEVFGNITSLEHVKYYDFKGMYAQCMLESFHVGEGYYDCPKNFNKAGFYTINFKSNMKIPILPIRHLGKLMFYNGSLTGTY